MHSLIAGASETGKTTLAKRLCSNFSTQGFKRLVLTSVWDDWDADYMTDDPDKFLQVVWASKNCIIFCDEAAETVGRYNVPMNSLATRSRHWGHSCFFISQDPTGISPIVRRQCSQLFLFACDNKAAEPLARDWMQPLLLNAPTLRRGEYLRALRFGPSGTPYISKGDAFK